MVCQSVVVASALVPRTRASLPRRGPAPLIVVLVVVVAVAGRAAISSVVGGAVVLLVTALLLLLAPLRVAVRLTAFLLLGRLHNRVFNRFGAMGFHRLRELLHNHIVQLKKLFVLGWNVFDDFEALVVQQKVANFFDGFALFVCVFLFYFVDVVLEQEVLGVLIALRSGERIVLTHFLDKLSKSDRGCKPDHFCFDQRLKRILVLF